MKKWTPALLSLLLSSSVWAGGHHQPFTGFYGGANVGLIQSTLHDDYDTVLQWPQAFHITLSSNAKVTDSSALAGLTIGYSTFISSGWVLGLEGRAHLQSLDTMNEETIQEVNSMLEIAKNTRVKVDQDFALVAKLGFACHCKFLMYGLVGADWAKVQLSTDALYQQNLGNLISGNIPNTSSHYEGGLMLGLGMEYALTNCSTIGLEYNYIDYNALNFENPMFGDLFVSGVPQVGSFITDNNSIKMQTSKVLLKFNYYFT